MLRGCWARVPFLSGDSVGISLSSAFFCGAFVFGFSTWSKNTLEGVFVFLTGEGIAFLGNNITFAAGDYSFKNNKNDKYANNLKVGSINSHRQILIFLGFDVLSSFGFFSVQIVSLIGHVARYAPSSTYNLNSKINPKYDKAN